MPHARLDGERSRQALDGDPVDPLGDERVARSASRGPTTTAFRAGSRRTT
jgi:hypothetical protein